MTIRTATAKLIIAAQLLAAAPAFGNVAGAFFQRSHRTEQISTLDLWGPAKDGLLKARQDLDSKDADIDQIKRDLYDVSVKLAVRKFKVEKEGGKVPDSEKAAIVLYDELGKKISKFGLTKELLDDAIYAADSRTSEMTGKIVKEEKKEDAVVPKEEKKETMTPEVKKEETVVPKKEETAPKIEEKEEQAPVKEEKREIAFENTQESQLAAIRSLNAELSAANSEKKLVAVIDQFGSMLDRAKGTMSMEVVKGFSEFFFALNDRADEFGGLADSKHSELKGKLDAELKRVLEQKKIDNAKKEETKEAPKEEKKEELKVEKTETVPKAEEKKEETVPKTEEKKEPVEEEKKTVPQKKVEIKEETETVPKREEKTVVPEKRDEQVIPEKKIEEKTVVPEKKTSPNMKGKVPLQSEDSDPDAVRIQMTLPTFDEANVEFQKLFEAYGLSDSTMNRQNLERVNELIEAANGFGYINAQGEQDNWRKGELKTLIGQKARIEEALGIMENK